MASAELSMLPEGLSSRLLSLERRIRWLRLAGGAGRLIVLGAVLLLAAVLADWRWELPPAVRYAMLGLFLVAVLAVLCRCILWPLLRRTAHSEAAALVEAAHPELQERLTSAIELSDPEIPESEKGSALMRTLLLRQTEKRAAQTDFVHSVGTASAYRWAAAAVAAVCLLLLPAIRLGDGYGLLLARFFTPWQNLERAANLYFEVAPGDVTIARGSDLEITAAPHWRAPSDQAEQPLDVRLHWENVAGEGDDRRMLWDDERGLYTATVPHVFHSLDFNVSALNARTRDFHVNVVEQPVITEYRLTVDPPAYTGRPSEVIDDGRREVWAFERSRLSLHVKFNKPLSEATLLRLASDDANDSPAERVGDAADERIAVPRPMTLRNDGLAAEIVFTAEQSGRFAIRAADAFGLHNDDASRWLRIIRDEPPVVDFADEQDEAAARPDDVLPVPVFAADDVGVAALELHYRVVTGGDAEGVLYADPGSLGGSLAGYEFPFDLEPLGLSDGAVVSIRARAADERPVPGPNEAWTQTRLVTINSDADPYGARAVAERQRRLQQLLAALREETLANREAVSGLQTEAESDQRQQLQFEQGDEAAELSEQQRDLAERVEQLAAVFDLHPLYANLSQQTREVAAGPLSDASERTAHAADAPVPETVADLKEAGEQLEAAARELAELERRFEELAELESDLLELRRLADQTERLAGDVADFDERRRRETPPGATPQEQAERRQREEQERRQLQAEQQRLSEDLDEMLARRPELADAALAHELQRLAELTRQAGEIADREEMLADALQREAQSQPLAERQQTLTQRAEELAAQPELAAAASADPLDGESLREAMQALEAGDLEQARERLNRAADAAEELSEQLARNDDLPADPQQAARELAERQQEIEERLQRARDNPDAEFDPREAARAQSAIQAAAQQLPVPEHARGRQQGAAEAAAETLRRLAEENPAAAAEAAQQSREALEQLAQQIGAPEQRRERALEQLRRLQEQQEELADQVDDALQQQEQGASPEQTAERLEQLAPEQQELAGQLERLDAPGAEQAQRSASEHAQQAARDLEQAAAEAAPASQAAAQQALDELQDRLEREPVRTESPPRQPSPLAESLAELARQQRELADQLDSTESPAAERGATPTDEPETAAESLAAEQSELAQDAAQLAVETARQRGSASAATAQARAATEQTVEAARQLAGGQPAEAARTAQQAAESAQQAAESLRTPPAGEGAPLPELAQQAEDLAERQHELADRMEQAASEPARRQALQRQGQERLEEATAELQRELSEVAENLAEAPLSQSDQAQRASRSSEAAQQAQAEMQAALSEMSEQNLSEASRSAREAAESLRQSSGQSGQQPGEQSSQQPGQQSGEQSDQQTGQQPNQQSGQQPGQQSGQQPGQQPGQQSGQQPGQQSGQQPGAATSGNSPVPSDVGGQVAQASRQLRQAGEQLAQGSQSGQPENGRSTDGDMSVAESGERQPGETQPGQGQPGSPAESLQQAAAALQNAASRLQPPMPTPGQRAPGGQLPQPAGSRAQPGMPSETTPTVAGGLQGVSLLDLDMQLEALSTRQWGELPGTLQTQLREAAQRRPDGDYSRLIRLYFEDIAQPRRPELDAPPASPDGDETN